MSIDIEKLRAKGIDERTLAICEKINANNARRDSCAGHDFEADIATYGKHRCKNCGYEADILYVQGYHDGVKHTKLPPEGDAE